MARSFICLSLAACTPQSSFIDVPTDVGYIAWIEISDNGEALTYASPLRHVDDSRVWSVAADRRVSLVGFREVTLRPAIDGVDEAVWATEPLRVPLDCEAHLAGPDWIDSASGKAIGIGDLPKLTAPWVQTACDGAMPGPDGLECSQCEQGTCPALIIESTPIEISETLDVSVHSVRWVDENTVVAATPRPGIERPVVRFEIERSVAGVRIPAIAPFDIEAASPTTMAWDGDRVSIAGSSKEVLRFDELGRDVRTVELPTGALVVSGARGGPTFVHTVGGAAYTMTGTRATMREDLPRRIYAIAVKGPGDFAVMTSTTVYRYRGASAPEVHELPGEFRTYLRRAQAPKPLLAIIGMDDYLVVPAGEIDPPKTPAYRLVSRSQMWASVDWPTSVEARFAAEFGGGFVIGGKVEAAGFLYFERQGESCAGELETPPINAIDVLPGGDTAVIVSSNGIPHPHAVLIRTDHADR